MRVLVAHVAAQLGGGGQLHLSVDHVRAVIELVVRRIELIGRALQLVHVLELAPRDAAAMVQVLGA